MAAVIYHWCIILRGSKGHVKEARSLTKCIENLRHFLKTYGKFYLYIIYKEWFVEGDFLLATLGILGQSSAQLLKLLKVYNL